jgi:hypothetical protein
MKSKILIIIPLIFLIVLSVSPSTSNEEPIIILSPENKTYFQDDVPLKFEVTETPILVGYQLDNEHTKWFMVKDGQTAQISQRELLYNPGQTQETPPTGQTWVEIDPVQCGGNQWEKDWALAHNKSVDDETSDLTGYPRHSYPFIIEQSQIDIITSYFKKQGITVSEVRSKYIEGLGALDCCSCPRGDKLWFFVFNPDVHKILDHGKTLDIGYKISEEPPT